MQDSRPEPVYLYSQTPKINRYACTKSSRRVSLGPIRESLPNQSTSGSARPRNLRIRLQGKARAKQKEIGNYRFCRFFPIFAVSFYHVSPTRYFDRRARETGCGFLSPVVRIPRPDLGGQFRPILAHIIVHVQFAVKAGFHLVTGHRFRVQFDARCVNFFANVPM